MTIANEVQATKDIDQPAAGARLLPYAALVVGILALGFSAMFVRWAAAPGPVTGLYRMAIATLVLTPLALADRRRNGRPWPGEGLRLAVLGGLMLALDLSLWNTSVNLTSAANATLFANTAPLWVALASWLLFRERLSGRFWFGLLVTLSGAAAVLGADFLRHPTLSWGDGMALGAGVFYGGYYLSTERARRTLGAAPYVWIMGAACSAILLALSLALGMPLFGYPAQTILAFVGLALVTQVTGYLAVGYALGHLPAAFVSPTMVGQPVVTAVLAIPLLGELPTPTQIVGGLAVLAGIILVHRSRSAVHPPGAVATPPKSRG